MSEQPLLTDREIEERLRVIEADAFPGEASERFAEQLAHLCWGVTAEGALTRLIEEIPHARLNRMVARHVMDRPDSRGTPDYAGGEIETVRERLLELGFGLGEADGEWTLTMPDGEELVGEYVDEQEPGVEADPRGDAICRVALVGVWLRTMRERATGDHPSP